MARGKWIGVGMVVIGMVGAVGVALRPLYTKAFAARAVRVQRSAAEARRAASSSGVAVRWRGGREALAATATSRR